MKHRLALSLACAIGLTASANAQNSQLSQGVQVSAIEFTFGGETFEVAVPKGYCTPTGDQAAVSAQIAAGDSQNETLADLQRCGSFGTDYMVIKTPRALPPVPLPKSVFVKMVAEQLQTTETGDAGMTKGQEDVAEMTGGEVSVDPTAYSYAGFDDDCAYIAGTLEVSAGEETNIVRTGSCLTLVGTRNFSVHSYSTETGGASVDALKTRSRDLANAITVK
ncbi:MAG: hypothetical protein AAGK01_09465 [Pseudomonadota bacterium]